MIPSKPAQVRFGWISPPDLFEKEQKFGLEDLSKFFSVQKEIYGWRINVLPDVEFPMNDNRLQMPDVCHVCDMKRIKYFEVYTPEAMRQISNALREIFAAPQPEPATRTVFKDMSRISTRKYWDIAKKESQDIGLDQLPSCVRKYRHGKYWSVRLPVENKLPPGKVMELNKKMGEDVRAFGISGGIDEYWLKAYMEKNAMIWHVDTVEGMAELLALLREHFAAQAEEDAKKSIILPKSWTMNVNIPKANRHQQQRLNQMAQLLADDMETPAQNQQQSTQKPKLKETGK